MQVGLFRVRQVSGYGDYPAKGFYLPEPGYHWLIGTQQVDYLTGIMYRLTEE